MRLPHLALFLAASPLLLSAAPSSAQTSLSTWDTKFYITQHQQFLNMAWFTISGKPDPAKFPPPIFEPYVASGPLPNCAGSVVPANNAAYCTPNNTLYYDLAFLAEQKRLAAAALPGSTGDFAILVAIAHEYGHQIRHQVGIRAANSVDEELGADCIAGAFARFMKENSLLTSADIENGRYSLKIIADKSVGPYTSELVITVLERDMDNAHGVWFERVGAFDKGFNGGAPACSSQLH